MVTGRGGALMSGYTVDTGQWVKSTVGVSREAEPSTTYGSSPLQIAKC